MTNQLANRNNSQTLPVSKVLNQAITEISLMIEEGKFDIHPDYSYKNAIQQARFALIKPIESGVNKGKTIMEICTPASILQTVMEMTQKGLNMAKSQCYPIPFGKTCRLMISYQGNVAIAKRDGFDIKDVYGYPVYEGEEFEMSFDLKEGIWKIETYKPDVNKWDPNNLKGAFAVIVNNNDEVKYTEYMTMEQIRKAWEMGSSKGNSPAHRNFPDQQAIKTVKNRAVKSFVNTTDDGAVISKDEEKSVYVDRDFDFEKLEEANKHELPGIEEDPEDILDEVDEDTGEIIDGPSALTEEEKEEILKAEAEQEKTPF